MSINLSDELIDQLLEENPNPGELFGDSGLIKHLTKRLVERALEGEMVEHLGYEKHAPEGRNKGNSRNGKTTKNVSGDFGTTTIEIPRDREGTFEPQIVKKGQRRLDGFSQKVISLYGRGLSTREIQGHLKDIYGAEVSPTVISKVTDVIEEDVIAWRNRPLEPVYPVVYLDAMFIKIREKGHIVSKPFYLALGINPHGMKEVLGIWVGSAQDGEGAAFWLQVLNDLKNRGLKDIFVACIDGLSGFPDAIRATYNQTQIQLCIVHMIRNSTKYVPHKDRKALCADLRAIYTAPNHEAADQQLNAFAEKWDAKYPMIAKSWRSKWDDWITFFAYPPEVRRILYTTNPMEAVNRQLRKITKTKGVFPSEKSALKLLYLGIQQATGKWCKPVHNWRVAIAQFAILFEDRMPHF